jgi:hypothetical protein
MSIPQHGSYSYCFSVTRALEGDNDMSSDNTRYKYAEPPGKSADQSCVTEEADYCLKLDNLSV